MATIILPTTLHQPPTNNTIYLVEHPLYFLDYQYHKLKLILHRASMKQYQQTNKTKYIEFNEYKKKINQIFNNHDTVTMYHPTNIDIIKEFKKIAKKYNTELIIIDNPSFILTIDEVLNYSKNRKLVIHAHFYKWIRQKTQILMTKNNKPYGGKWSFDTENRKPFPNALSKDPTKLVTKSNKFIKEAITYVNKHFKNNPGSTDFYLPTTHKEATLWFNNFLTKRFKKFGEYQDAVSPDIEVGYHSLISPLLNIGLLTPLNVIQKAQKYGITHKIPMNSIEGFIRQIIGWRELVRVVYLTKPDVLYKNYFNAKNKLNKKAWYHGTESTGFKFIDSIIKKYLDIGYLHHIERLMYIGNYCLLAGISPNKVMNWFMGLLLVKPKLYKNI